MKLGLDGKPSKSIVLWRELDTILYQQKVLECDKWNNMAEYLENTYNQYCISILEKTKEYCKTKICRRSLIKNYFKISPQSEVNRDTCCDNCVKIINEQVPAFILYKGVTSSNMIDVTDDARTFLTCFKCCDCNILQCTAVLIGRIMKFSKPSRLDFFGAGRHKPEGYWIVIYQRLIEKSYINENVNKITRLGNRFLRYKTRIFNMPVRFNVKGYLEKKNVHISLENGKVTTTPKDKVIYEENRDIPKSVIFINLQDSSNKQPNAFDFEKSIATKPLLRRAKKKLDVFKENISPPTPSPAKID